MRRLVIDANTLVSGSISPHGESPPCLLYGDLAGARFEMIVCPELLAEIAETLRKPYFVERIGESGVDDIVAGIVEAATVFEDLPISKRFCAIQTTTTSSPWHVRQMPRRS